MRICRLIVKILPRTVSHSVNEDDQLASKLRQDFGHGARAACKVFVEGRPTFCTISSMNPSQRAADGPLCMSPPIVGMQHHDQHLWHGVGWNGGFVRTPNSADGNDVNMTANVVVLTADALAASEDASLVRTVLVDEPHACTLAIIWSVCPASRAALPLHHRSRG